MQQLLAGAVDTALHGGAGWVLRRQLGQQACPVVDGFLVTLTFEGGDAKQTQAGGLVRIGLEGFIGQCLYGRRPLLTLGEVPRLGPLPEQFRLTASQLDRAFEELCRLCRTLLGHIGTPKEIQAFGGIRLSCHRPFEARSHLSHGLRCLGEFTGQFDLVAGAIMQVQP